MPQNIKPNVGQTFAKAFRLESQARLLYITPAFSATKQKSVGFSVNYLHFGRELNNNIAVLLGNPRVDECENHSEFVTKMVERLSHAHQLANECTKVNAEQNKRYYDKNVRIQSDFLTG